MTLLYKHSLTIGASFRDVNAISLPDGITGPVMPCQTHSANVAVVDTPDRVFDNTDALVTARPGVAIGVRTADCVPILLHDPVAGIIGAVHAGWKGTLARIALHTVRTMSLLGADPANINAVIGPSVCGLCYEVSPEIASLFSDAVLSQAVVASPEPDPAGLQSFGPDTIRLDLKKANRTVLVQAGLDPSNIHDPGICTRHHTGWPSWRLNPGTSRRLATLIWMGD